MREISLERAASLIGSLTTEKSLFLLVGLYWGEGTKRDFSLINSDPFLIQTFIVCLKTLGISADRLSVSLRIHTDISIEKSKDYWTSITGVEKNSIRAIEIIEGKKKGKLPYGMCRIRVLSGIQERLLIQSAILLIGKESNKKLLFE